MKAVALIASGIEQGRLVEVARTGIDSLEIKSRLWEMYYAGKSPDIALAYVSINASIIVGIMTKTRRQEGSGSERVARPSFWGWVINDSTQVKDCLLRLMFFPSLSENESEVGRSWIDQIIESSDGDQSFIQEHVSQVLNIVSRFNIELSDLVEVSPRELSLGSGLPGRDGFSTSYVSAGDPCIRDLLQIALKECGSWIDDDGALIGSFGAHRSGGVTTYRVDRYSDKNDLIESEKVELNYDNPRRKGWGALKWWK